MASQGYRDWLNAGRPYTLIRPAKAVQAALRGHGLTVYDYPNDAHLQADVPEDHTPFSVTGWPGANRRWKARALDVMPRSGSLAHRRENADIARQLIRDRDAGVPGAMWIKYINWTDESGVCRQERWMDAAAPLRRTTRTSTDAGHIHISGRSDVDDDTRADGYNPITRMDGEIMANASEIIAAWSQGMPRTGDGTAVAPVDWRIRDERWQASVTAQLAADKVRDDALAAAVKALAIGSGLDGAALLADIDRAITAALAPLQQQLADVQARNVKLAQALAAAGGALDGADDDLPAG